MPGAELMAFRSSPEPVLDTVRRAVKQTLFNVGYYHRRLSQLAFPGVAILCYHGIRGAGEPAPPFNDLHVDEETFSRHCRFIADECHPISLDDLRASREGRRSLPARPVIVTFDDGYRSVLERALPSLERHGIPAAVFVCSEPVLTGRHFWFDTLWRRSGEQAVTHAMSMPYAEWRALRDAIATRAAETDAHRPMTPTELRRLAASPLVEIGGHTMRHPVLRFAPIDEQREEISGCRTALQEAIGKPIRSFAYPFGRVAEHYQPGTPRVIEAAGFDLAFTTNPSFVPGEVDPFQIPRFVMLGSVDDAELAHRLVHSWHATGTTI